MRLRPGSFLWLLRHELRLNWRSMRQPWLLVAVLAVCWVVVHAFAGFVAKTLVGTDLPAALRALPILLQASVGAGLVACVLGSMGLTFSATVEALYGRSDYDLLLSSPIPREAILPVRQLASAVSIASLLAFILLPFAHVFAVTLHPGWLLLYAVPPLVAMLASGLSLPLVLALVRAVGVRRARMLGQVLAAIMTFGFVVVSQLPQLARITEDRERRNGAAAAAIQSPEDLGQQLEAFAAQPWVEPMAWVGRVAMGEFPLVSVLVVAAVLISYVRVARLCAQPYFDSLLAAANLGARPRAARTRAVRFRAGGPMAALRRKEWRTVWRDPALLSQVLLQSVAFTGIFLPLLRYDTGGPDAVSYAWGAVVAAGAYLSGSLSWLAMSAEDSPELIGASPVPRRHVILAKLQAAVLPAAVPAVMVAAILVERNAWVAATILGCGLAAAISTAQLHVWHQKPARRSDFRQRSKRSLWLGILEAILVFGWSGTTALAMAFGWWGLIPGAATMVFALAVLGPLGREDRTAA